MNRRLIEQNVLPAKPEDVAFIRSLFGGSTDTGTPVSARRMTVLRDGVELHGIFTASELFEIYRQLKDR